MHEREKNAHCLKEEHYLLEGGSILMIINFPLNANPELLLLRSNQE